MKISSIKINNFRGYENEVEIKFDTLTAIIGKNDVGKSTVLEALDIFFNDGKGAIKQDKNDLNKNGVKNGNNEIIIGVCFKDLPDKIIIDTSSETNLKEEYLLNNNGELEIIKKYPNGGSAKVYIKANHPSNPRCSNLLSMKNSDLQKRIKEEGLDSFINLTENPSMRKIIWEKYGDDLQLQESEIDVSKEDGKKIWEKIQTYLPVYSLFQSDRKNSDTDSEAQDPLKESVKQIINDKAIQEKLSEIAEFVREEVSRVSDRTLEKIKEMDPEIANSLNPIIPETKDLKWQDVFKIVSITGDEDIPINKRGSGVRRLILLNFFRAEVERRAENNDNANVIYAIEEPETSQHTNNQYKLIESLISLSKLPKTQILITTHSPNIVKKLDFENLRLISSEGQRKTIENVEQGILKYPSLNEVNYLAFGEITEEYHNELYGYIKEEDLFNEYKKGKKEREYIRKEEKGTTKKQNKILSEYIRHLINHPENKENARFTDSELKESIDLMRNFIHDKKNN